VVFSAGLGLVTRVVLGLDVGDVEEPVAAHREVDERRLNGGLEVHDAALVDVAGETLEAGALDVEFLEDPILDDGDPALLRLEDVDEHFFFHASILPNDALGAVECEGATRESPMGKRTSLPGRSSRRPDEAS
jgi:hypothetical protein